jgi:hypothetical protein
MFVVDDALLAVAAKAILGCVTPLVVEPLIPQERVRRFLGRDPQRLAFKKALQETLDEFAKTHPDQAEPFFDKAFLAGPAAPILARCLSPGEGTSAGALAAACADQLTEPPANRGEWIAQAEPAAAEFISSLSRHLRESEEFRPLLDSKALDATAIQTADTVRAVQELTRLVDDVFRLQSRAPDPLAGYIRDFRAFCEERTRTFVGREFLLDEIDHHLRDAELPSGYIIVRGEPGIGKSALIAHLVQSRGYVHHFNIALQGLTSPEDFLGNICAQLIIRYELPYQELPLPRATGDGLFLAELLREAAARARETSELPIVIAVDALDEAEHRLSENVLRLPPELPEGVYVLATTRPKDDSHLQVDRERSLALLDDDPRNQEDIRAYVSAQLAGSERERFAARIAEWKIDKEEFVDALSESSEGNFMYLVHVMKDVSSGRLTKQNVGDVEELPRGLNAYYTRHWREMKDANRDRFQNYQRPVVSMLATGRESVTAARILEWVNARPGCAQMTLGDVVEVLSEWREFLDVGETDPPIFRIYHASFREFLDQTVNLDSYRRVAVKSTMAKLRPG